MGPAKRWFLAICAAASAACAASSASTSPPQPSREVAARPQPALGPKASHQARVRSHADGWIDIVVSDAGEPGRQACEFHLADVLSRLDPNAVAERGCGLAPLPAVVPEKTGGHLLVQPRTPTELDVALTAQLRGGAAPAPWVEATVTTFNRLPSRDECEALLARLTASQERTAVLIAEEERSFVREQLLRTEARRDSACREQAELASRCGPAADGSAALACTGAEGSPQCRQAREQALEQARCESLLQNTQRACAVAESMLRSLRARGAPAPQPPPSRFACRPE